VVSLTPQLLYPPVPTEQEAGWALEPIGASARTDKSHAPASIQIADCSACSLVTTDYAVLAT
jgi:hypothetical protein